MRIEARPLALLTREAVADASRRRIVPAVGVICFLSLLLVQSCSTCTANVGIDGRMQTVDLGRWSGIASFTLLGLWSVVLAGLLAADHLRSIFEDGSATLLLTRPLSRPTLALARLAGSLVVSGGAGLVVCAGATFFLVARGGLALAPAFWATAAVATGLATVAALAMLASLFLPRIVTMLVVLGFVGWVGAANVGAVSGVALTGISFVLDRFGPPLLSGILLALSPWADATIGSLSSMDVSLRAIAWLVASIAVLLVVFDQRELTRLEPR